MFEEPFQLTHTFVLAFAFAFGVKCLFGNFRGHLTLAFLWVLLFSCKDYGIFRYDCDVGNGIVVGFVYL